MDCKTAKRRLYRWLDGQMDQAGSQAVQAHIQSCGLCNKEAQSARSLHALLHAQSPTEAPSSQFDATFWRRCAEHAQERQTAWVSLWRVWDEWLASVSLSQAVAALMVAFIVGTAGGVFTFFGEDQTGSDTRLAGFAAVHGVSSASFAESLLTDRAYQARGQ